MKKKIYCSISITNTIHSRLEKMENLIVFGGKGGVGKSSISAATAIYLANQLKNKKILLISFDIAHNLSIKRLEMMLPKSPIIYLLLNPILINMLNDIQENLQKRREF